jgi:hypothetical protein
MSRTYPRIGAKNKLPSVPLCCICGRVATWRLDVQVSYMRGDDEVRDVCDEHRQAPAEALLNGANP